MYVRYPKKCKSMKYKEQFYILHFRTGHIWPGCPGSACQEDLWLILHSLYTYPEHREVGWDSCGLCATWTFLSRSQMSVIHTWILNETPPVQAREAFVLLFPEISIISSHLWAVWTLMSLSFPVLRNSISFRIHASGKRPKINATSKMLLKQK